MRVLMVHCRYQIRGGEDECFDAEQRLLRAAGVEVDAYEEDNKRVEGQGALKSARETVWSQESYRALRERIRRGRHDVVHVHNFFPLISPAVYYAAAAEGAAVVQTLHNYRLMCPNGIFYRDGRVCEDCRGRAVPWPGVVHACYRGSRGASGAVATMLATHNLLGTWRSKVDAYIALNDFMRRKYVEGGLPAERVVVKPNFVEHDPGMGAGDGGFALFVARLNKEKGVGTLLEAWRRLGTRLPLRIMGDGPMTAEVEAAAREIPGIEFLGRRPLADFYEQLGRARFFLFTSTWYEGFPRTIIEAYARGTPIIASAIGPIAEVVADGRTGVHFRPGDAADLVAKVEAVLGDEGQMAAMRTHARAEFEAKFTAEANLPQMLAVYERALAGIRHVTPGRTASRAQVWPL